MSTRRKLLLGVGLSAAIGAGLFVWRWYLPTRRAVDIGAGILAKQICSCVYVASRALDDCRADQFPSTDPIRVELQSDRQRVRAWLPALGERFAGYREDFGCSLE